MVKVPRRPAEFFEGENDEHQNISADRHGSISTGHFG